MMVERYGTETITVSNHFYKLSIYRYYKHPKMYLAIGGAHHNAAIKMGTVCIQKGGGTVNAAHNFLFLR